MRRSGARLGSAARSSGVIKRSTLGISLGGETGCRAQPTGIISSKVATRQDLRSCIAINILRVTEHVAKESRPARDYASLSFGATATRWSGHRIAREKTGFIVIERAPAPSIWGKGGVEWRNRWLLHARGAGPTPRSWALGRLVLSDSDPRQLTSTWPTETDTGDLTGHNQLQNINGRIHAPGP
jgi:hypothetical protein